MNGLCVRAAGAEDSVHPRLQLGASGRPLNFTVRRQDTMTNVWGALQLLVRFLLE